MNKRCNFKLCHDKYLWKSSFLVNLHFSRLHCLALFSTNPEHLFFRTPLNGNFCKPNSKFPILLKGFQGSNYCSPGALLKLQTKVCQKLYATAALGSVHLVESLVMVGAGGTKKASSAKISTFQDYVLTIMTSWNSGINICILWSEW